MEPVSAPQRIQRKRTKGWRMPPNTVYVGRPTKWGNPHWFSDWVPESRAPAVEKYRQQLMFQLGDESNPLLWAVTRNSVEELRGKNLACWCPLGQPCHADILLEVANA